MKKNSNKKIYLITSIIFIIGFFFSFNIAKATTNIYFDLEKTTISEGDTFSVDLKISTPDKMINVIDGTILYDSSKLNIKEINTKNSLFSLWPKPPTFLNDKGTLSFVGGTPDGFKGKEETVFKIVFIAKSEGKTKIDFLDGLSVFLNDGKGTSINPWIKPLSLNILKSPVSTQIKDKIQYKKYLISIVIVFIILVFIFWMWRLRVAKLRKNI